MPYLREHRRSRWRSICSSCSRNRSLDPTCIHCSNCKMERVTVVLAATTGAPLHFPLYFAASVGPWDWFWPGHSDTWWGRWGLAGLSHLSLSCCSAFGTHFEMEEAWVWVTGWRTLVNLQQTNYASLSRWDLLPKHGLAILTQLTGSKLYQSIYFSCCYHVHLLKMENIFFLHIFWSRKIQRVKQIISKENLKNKHTTIQIIVTVNIF